MTEAVPFIGIDRHRLGADGRGVTTLAAFHGCPLRCKYCLNRRCLESAEGLPAYTPEQLFKYLSIDNLYFIATGGGVCFGGGEPLLRFEAIADFCQQCPSEWQIYIETSLNVERRALETVAPYIDHYYIDVKDMTPDIYRHYTSIDNSRVLENLRWLADHIDLGKVTIRLPHIPDFNTQADIDKSRQQLEAMGFRDFDCFEYIIAMRHAQEL